MMMCVSGLWYSKMRRSDGKVSRPVPEDLSEESVDRYN